MRGGVIVLEAFRESEETVGNNFSFPSEQETTNIMDILKTIKEHFFILKSEIQFYSIIAYQ